MRIGEHNLALVEGPQFQHRQLIGVRRKLLLLSHKRVPVPAYNIFNCASINLSECILLEININLGMTCLIMNVLAVSVQ
jgi:hypothetical protein